MLVYSVFGILLIAIVFTVVPIVGPHLTETSWPKKGLLVLAGFGISVFGFYLIIKGYDHKAVSEGYKIVLEAGTVLVTVILTLFANWAVRTVYRLIYDAGFKSAESAYVGEVNDLRTENAKLLQFLADEGIELPVGWYDKID